MLWALRAGIVGAGRFGLRLAGELLLQPDVEVVAVADPRRPARDAFTRSFKVALSVASHRRIAAEPGIELVYIVSPPATHATVAVDCLSAGKHVVCGQPIATTIADAEKMIAAQSSGARLFVALPARYDPANRMAADLIEAGNIGYPFLTLSSYVEDEFDRLNDWHDWLGTWEQGGGILMLRGSALLDLLIFLLGPVAAVSATCTRFAIEPLNKAEDTALLDLDFEEEISVQAALTGAARWSAWPEAYAGSAQRVEVFGDEGALRLASSERGLTVSARKSRHVVIEPSETGLPTDMHRDFLDCITHGRAPLVTPEDALAALRVVLAAYKSSQMKRRVETSEEL
ncbi:MAG: Gfo/Idh/MocA family protein [Armatimonadota bacterium]